jgi:hypothetical protein
MDLTTQHRDFVAQDQEFDVLGALVAAADRLGAVQFACLAEFQAGSS